MENGRNPDSAYLERLTGDIRRPLFIVGDHRSGTTLLHRLLAGSECFNYVSAYHVINYPEILTHHFAGDTEAAKQRLGERFQSLGLVDRIIDNVPADPDSPVEYGFVISGWANTRRPKLTERTQPIFEQLCRKIQTISDSDRPLLLKNPWDVLSFAEIKRLIPDARFVFIHRHPVAVLSSQLRAIQVLLQERNPFVAMMAPWYDRLFDRPVQLFFARNLDRPPVRIWSRLLGLHAVRVANYLMEHQEQLPKQDWVSIRYEDLCRQPNETMAELFSFAEVQPQETVDFSQEIRPRPLKASREAQRVFRGLRKKLAPYLERHGYDAEPEILGS